MGPSHRRGSRREGGSACRAASRSGCRRANRGAKFRVWGGLGCPNPCARRGARRTGRCAKTRIEGALTSTGRGAPEPFGGAAACRAAGACTQSADQCTGGLGHRHRIGRCTGASNYRRQRAARLEHRRRVRRCWGSARREPGRARDRAGAKRTCLQPKHTGPSPDAHGQLR